MDCPTFNLRFCWGQFGCSKPVTLLRRAPQAKSACELGAHARAGGSAMPAGRVLSAHVDPRARRTEVTTDLLVEQGGRDDEGGGAEQGDHQAKSRNYVAHYHVTDAASFTARHREFRRTKRPIAVVYTSRPIDLTAWNPRISVWVFELFTPLITVIRSL